MFHCNICRTDMPYIYERSHSKRCSRLDRLQSYRCRLNLDAIRKMASEVGDTPATFVQDAPPPSLGRRIISKIRSFLGF